MVCAVPRQRQHGQDRESIMRAVLVRSYGGPEVLATEEVPTPDLGAGQVRIAVRAATVNPVDLAIRAGQLAGFLPERDGYLLGWDVCGVVDALGEYVTE